MSTIAILVVLIALGFGHTWLVLWILPFGFLIGLVFGVVRAVIERARPRLRLLHLFLHPGADAPAPALGVYFPVEQMPAWLQAVPGRCRSSTRSTSPAR